MQTLKTSVGYFAITAENNAVTSVVFSKRKPTAKQTLPDRTASKCSKELFEYFNGTRSAFTISTDLSGLSLFAQDVLGALKKIPKGSTVTYAGLAEMSGHPGAARAVGTVMAKNPIPIIYPCHRVVACGGRLGGFGMGTDVKRKLLALEGVSTSNISK